MPIKSRLFASVAVPVLSLPLIIQPVHAGPIGLSTVNPPVAASNLVQVQEQPAAEEGEEIIKRRQSRENAEEPQGERPSRREQRAQDDNGEGGERPQRRERQAEEQQQERPRREQRAEEPEAERPRQRERQAEQGEGGEPTRQRAQQAEEQAPERPRREQRRENAEQAPEQAPEQQQRQTREPAAEQPAPVQQAEEPKPREQRAAEQPQAERPSQAERPAEEPQRERPRREQQNAEQPAESKPAQQAEDPAARPEPTPRSAEQPAGERPRQREQQAGESETTPRPPRQEAQDGQSPGRPPRDGQPSEQRATSGGERTEPRPVEQSAEQPMLPVENGAAVLDSAKEQRPDRPARDGERPRGERPRDPARQQAQEPAAPPPRNDADAQANERISNEQREQWRRDRRELVEERGERMNERPEFERPRGWDIQGPVAGRDRDQGRNQGRDRDGARGRDRDSGRVIISIDNQNYVRHNDSRRFYEDGRGPEYERLGDGRYREVVERSDGTRVVTIRNRYGEVVQRSRIVRGGEEYVLYYAPELLEDRRDYTWRDPGDDLPPMRLTVPVDDYIIDTSSEPDRDYYEFLEQPPVERVERPYSLDEVRYSARIRDKVPRIDLDTITFATGSAEVPMNQARSLRKVADAINQVLEKDPSETFLIEGHTDAVGSDDSNLILSDERAESVAVVLSEAFGIPPENLTTQGYGEQYLKVNTDAANQENRRVTIRRITPLVKPVASNQ